MIKNMKAKILLFTDSSFAIFSALQILKKEPYQAMLMTNNAAWVKKLENSAYLPATLIDTWPRGIKRYFPIDQKRTQIQQQIIQYLKQQQPDEIWLHEIYSDQWNWIAYTYKKLFPKGRIRLLPESFLNGISLPVSAAKKRSQWAKSLLTRSYHPFDGQWIGLNARFKGADLIEDIFLPSGFPHLYPDEKVQYFDYALSAVPPQANKAILVEQALIDRKLAHPDQLKFLYEKLKEDWAKHQISEIYIAPHPRAKERDFAFSSLPLFERNEIFLEEDIAQQGFGHIYSHYSMIFFSATQLKSRFVSFGLDICEGLPESEHYKTILKNLGVSLL